MMLCNRILLFVFSWFSFMSISFAKSGLYLTLETGSAHQQGLPSKAIDRFQEKPGALRVGLGYNHDITILLGILGIGGEIAMSYLDKEIYPSPIDTLKVYSRTFEFLFPVQLHISRLDITGKLGGIRHTIVISDQVDKKDKTKIEPLVNVGSAFNFTPHFAATINYIHIFGSGYIRIGTFPFEMTDTSINELLAGIRYTF
jgi:opacity protein-like surface antigen